MITLINDVSVLTDSELLDYSVRLAQHENQIGLKMIACLREAERRMLYAQVGASSLWDYATRYLKLSKGNAQMKIDAMRLARDNKTAQEKILTGELSILNAAKVNSFFRQEKKAGHDYTPKEKTEVIESVLGLSQSKCELALLARAPESIPPEKVRPLTETKTELKIVVDEDTLRILNRLKELLSNKMPHATYAQLFDYLAREKVTALEKKMMTPEKGTKSEISAKAKEPATPATGATAQSIVPPTIETTNQTHKSPSSHPDALESSGESSGESSPGQMPVPTPRVYIPVSDHRWAMRQAHGQCQHLAANGLRCTSRWQLQLDHIVPLACGGKNERGNYRIVCKVHNLYEAKIKLGAKVMEKYVNSLT